MTLPWICSDARQYKSFVSIREIQENSKPIRWGLVPGKLNVADDVSRGLNVENLNDRWQKELQFLPDWPQESSLADPAEVKRGKLNVHVCENKKFQNWVGYKRLSSFRKLIRVTVYVPRFLKNPRAYVYSRSEE